MSDNRISFRTDNETNIILKKITKEIPDGISRLLRKLIFFYLKKESSNEKINLEIKKEIKDYLNKKRFEKKKKEHKEKLFYYYLISNTLKTIYKLSSSHLINSGQLNMDIIIKVINSAEEVYNTYPEDIKNDLRSEFDNLKLLKGEQVLIEKMKMLKLIAFKKQMKKLDDEE